MMRLVYVCFVAILISDIDAGEIESKIMKYFDSDAVKLLQKDWQIHKTAYQNALLVAITETYGYRDMNVYVKKTHDTLKLSSGFLHSDNQVQIMLLNLYLEELPHLRMPEVEFNLPSNVLQIEGSISKMIVQANYMVFRNKSDIIYALQDQNPNKNSPFRFQQVQTVGKLAIVIEGCVLSGGLLTVLNGQTVNLGHSLLQLNKCLYTFEISTPGFGGPPVIVRYNTKSEGLSLEHLLMKPLRNELMPKLQAALFSYINTTAIFGGDFPKIRHQQANIFREASNYINRAIRRINELTIKKNQGIIEMEDFVIKWDDALEGGSNTSVIELRKMVLTGLDTLYSAHIGGPYKLPGMKIGEEIRFDFLQMRGEVYFGNEVTRGSYEFSVEIRDVTAQVTIGINVEEDQKYYNDDKMLSTSRSVKSFEIIGWRTIDFSIPGIDFVSTESFITGYLLNTLPKHLVEHLHEVYREATDEHLNEDHEHGADDDIQEEEEVEQGSNLEGNNDGNEEYVDAQKFPVQNVESAENNDNNEDDTFDAQQDAEEQEELNGEMDVDNSDENKNLLNDTPKGVMESPSDEVDQHLISRQRLIKIKDKKHSAKTKHLTNNEV